MDNLYFNLGLLLQGILNLNLGVPHTIILTEKLKTLYAVDEHQGSVLPIHKPCPKCVDTTSSLLIILSDAEDILEDS